MQNVDITIIGAGVVGLSIASSLSTKFDNVFVIERHNSFGQETSSRNSEVIHAGIYYPQGSLKSRLCLRGNELMYEICEKNRIPHKNTGKLIVATNAEEARQLPNILETARNNGAKDVRIVDIDEIKELEPKVNAIAAVHCPTSGIVDSHSLMQYYEATAKNNGAELAYGVEVISIYKKNGGYIVSVRDVDGSEFSFETRVLINSAGLGSDHIAELAGVDIDKAEYRIYHKKGIYYRVMHKTEEYPEMLIYPVPPSPGTVGIHTTPDLGGGMRLGPYDYWVEEIDYSVGDEYRDLFYDSCKPFLPYLEKDDITPEGSGIHPKIQKPGEPIKDFVIRNESDRGLDDFINLVGIESPGLTSSPAIGEMVLEMVIDIS